MFYKKILAMVLALSMLALTACGAKEAAPEEAAPAATEETTEEATEEAALEGTINYVSWMTGGEDLPYLEAFMDANPGVEIVNRSLDGTNYAEGLRPLILNGDIPDVFLVNNDVFVDYVKSGYLRPLTEFAAVTEQGEKAADFQSWLTYEGTVYGYAINGSKGNEYVYYNKVFFEENNLKVPKTVEEFEDLCAQIKELGTDPLLVPAGDAWAVTYTVANHLNASRKELGHFDSKAMEIGLLKGEIKMSDLYGTSVRKLEEYRENGWISEGALSMGWEAAMQYLVDGGGAMLCTGNWGATSAPIQDNTNEGFELGAFALPGVVTSNGKGYTSASVDRILVLAADSEYPEIQNAYFEYFTSEEVMREYCESQGLAPVSVEAETNPVLKDANESFNNDYSYGKAAIVNQPNGYNANVSQYMADVCAGVSADEILEKMDADYETALFGADVDALLAACEE